MWRYRFLVLALVVLGPLGPTTDALGQQTVTVMFQPGVAHLPQGMTKCAVNDASFSSGDVSLLLEDFGVDSIAMALPDFDPADSMAVASTGEVVKLTDWSALYTVRPAIGMVADSLIVSLNQMTGIVVFAELTPEPQFAEAPIHPNDTKLKNGDQWGVGDIRAPNAWGYSEGLSSISIAILDNGFTDLHPEFSGRFPTFPNPTDLTWDSSTNQKGHGFRVAGVAAANANNGRGIAGVDWNALLISEDITGSEGDKNILVDAIVSAEARGASVLNHSYVMTPRDVSLVDSSWAVGAALAEAYRLNKVNVAAMGNVSNSPATHRQFPASYERVMIAVGATNKADAHWPNSITGPHIDVSAPGVDIESTYPCGNPTCTITGEYYEPDSGTSFSAPVVSGIASLILAKYASLHLYNDDVKNIIRFSANDVSPPGWDDATGWGRVDARRAVTLLDSPNRFTSGTMKPGDPGYAPNDTGYVQLFGINFFAVGQGTPNLYGPYDVRRHTVKQAVTFPSGLFSTRPHVWGRGVATKGWWPGVNPNYGIPYCDTVPVTTAVNTTGALLRTYLYDVDTDHTGQYGHWFPTDPQHVEFGWAALEVVPAPDSTESYFVPQAVVPGMGVVEGHSATQYFRTCPRADGIQVLPNNSRIKVVVKDAGGNAIPGISAADVFVLLNGRSIPQGLYWEGPDSIIANRQYNPAWACPALQAIYADSATNNLGSTYITFIGPRGVPDSTRKWGHFDTEMPVYVLGTKLQGRAKSDSTNGSYTLRIRNLDCAGGITTTPNYGELINSSDSNYLHAHLAVLGGAYEYFLDFDESGVVDVNDEHFLQAHFFHTCHNPQ